MKKIRKNSFLYKLMQSELKNKIHEPYRCGKCGAPFSATKKKLYEIHIKHCEG